MEYTYVLRRTGYTDHTTCLRIDEVATGLHLREYSAHEIREMFLAAGFKKVDFYSGGRGRYVRMPTPAAMAAETTFKYFPKLIRDKVPDLPFALYSVLMS